MLPKYKAQIREAVTRCLDRNRDVSIIIDNYSNPIVLNLLPNAEFEATASVIGIGDAADFRLAAEAIEFAEAMAQLHLETEHPMVTQPR